MSEQVSGPDQPELRLFRASLEGDAATVQRLLEEGCDPTAVQPCGAAPVHAACHFGHVAVLQAMADAADSRRARRVGGEQPSGGEAPGCGGSGQDAGSRLSSGDRNGDDDDDADADEGPGPDPAPSGAPSTGAGSSAGSAGLAWLVDVRSKDGLGPYKRVRGGRGQPKRLRPAESATPQLPLHCYQGRTPLMFAVAGGQAEVAAWLLAHGADPALQDCHSLSCRDLAAEQVALAGEGGGGSGRLGRARSLLGACGGGASEASSSSSSGRRLHADAVTDAMRKRESALVERLRAVEAARRAAAISRGLARVEEAYVQRHPRVYSGLWEGPGSGFVPICDVQEPAPGVLVFPLLTHEFATEVWEELDNYVAMASKLGLPLHRRYDLNYSQLEHCGFAPLLEALNASVQVLVARAGLEATRAAAAVRLDNYVQREGSEKLALKVHQDKYRLTLNVCLRTSADLQGSTVSFFHPPAHPDTVPSEVAYTHHHTVGVAVLHSAKTWHRTDPIEQGCRGSLILWSE